MVATLSDKSPASNHNSLRAAELQLGCERDMDDDYVIGFGRSQVISGMRRFRSVIFRRGQVVRSVVIPCELATRLERALDTKAPVQVHRVRFSRPVGPFRRGDSFVYALTVAGATFAPEVTNAHEYPTRAWLLALLNAAWWSAASLAALLTTPLVIGAFALAPAYRRARMALQLAAQMPVALALSRYLTGLQSTLQNVRQI